MNSISIEKRLQESIREIVREEIEKRIVELEKQQEQLFLNAKIISVQLGHLSTLLNHSYKDYLFSREPVDDTGTQGGCNV